MSLQELKWYILSIKQKKESDVKKNLDGLGIESYIPMYKRKKKVNKSKIDVVVPLFPGYIFCKFKFEKNFQKVRYLRGVKKVLGSSNSVWIVDDEKIEDLKRREENGLIKMKVIKKELKPGSRIVVDEGDFDGWEGIFFEDLPDEQRAVILLTSVSYSSKLIIPKDFIKSAI